MLLPERAGECASAWREYFCTRSAACVAPPPFRVICP
jgi:hypothetical protein